ncbi:hypothetical protein [Acidithrix ferrooxidans]|uniref:hypothetical protein n=1 Tax=Acidithrix ferrooxidans TaxID=1280514 RepID=UPI001364B427|nr:hypothetical protein [Acidithrix ferrooxidans]
MFGNSITGQNDEVRIFLADAATHLIRFVSSVSFVSRKAVVEVVNQFALKEAMHP